MIDRSSRARHGGTLIGRRSVLALFAAGMVVPLIGVGPAWADEGPDDEGPHQPPDDTGAAPWW